MSTFKDFDFKTVCSFQKFSESIKFSQLFKLLSHTMDCRGFRGQNYAIYYQEQEGTG